MTVLSATVTPTASVCQDALPNCATVAGTFGVCRNQTLARQTCQKYCNLCGIGKKKFDMTLLNTSET